MTPMFESFLPSTALHVEGIEVPEAQALHFEIERQNASEWCWSAVACSVSRYLDESSEWTQCRLAAEELGGACCDDCKACDRPWYLGKALQRVGFDYQFDDGPCSFPDLVEQMRLGRPVCIRLEWKDGSGAHFIVIYGVHDDALGRPHVLLSDSLFGDSSHLMDELVDGTYQAAPCRWTDTYLVREKK